jgi:hypothetical protein
VRPKQDGALRKRPILGARLILLSWNRAGTVWRKATNIRKGSSGFLMEDRGVTLAGWEPSASAPFDRDLQLAVLDRDGVHALVFPCRRILGGWLEAQTKRHIAVKPTHWRNWVETA